MGAFSEDGTSRQIRNRCQAVFRKRWCEEIDDKKEQPEIKTNTWERFHCSTGFEAILSGMAGVRERQRTEASGKYGS
jgi:hypothetical protein